MGTRHAPNYLDLDSPVYCPLTFGWELTRLTPGWRLRRPVARRARTSRSLAVPGAARVMSLIRFRPRRPIDALQSTTPRLKHGNGGPDMGCTRKS